MVHAGGRPTKMTPETISKLEQVYSYGASDIEACAHADIGLATLYRYCEEHPEFRERKERLKEKPTLLARQTVIQAIKTDPHLAFNYLTRKQKKEFSERIENDITTAGQPLTTSSDEVIQIAARVAEELRLKKTS